MLQHWHSRPLVTCSARKGDGSLNTKGWIGDKSCLMTIDERASVIITGPDITAGLPKRNLIFFSLSYCNKDLFSSSHTETFLFILFLSLMLKS
jgi:hypothetical protein